MSYIRNGSNSEKLYIWNNEIEVFFAVGSHPNLVCKNSNDWNLFLKDKISKFPSSDSLTL